MFDIESGQEEDVHVIGVPEAESDQDHFTSMYAEPYVQGVGEETSFRIGQTFGDVNVLRAALKDYIVKIGYEIKRLKNNNLRVPIKCPFKGCPWRLYVYRLADKITFMVKTLNEEHNALDLLRIE